LRICYLAGGRSVHTQKWVRFFAERGHDVYLATFGERSQIEGVKVRKLRYFSKVAYPFRILAVRKAVKEINPDILHAHYISHNGVYGALTGFKPFVVTAWGDDALIEPKKSRVKRYLVEYALKRANLITCDAEHMREAMIRLGADPEKISLIRFGIDTKKFSLRQKSETLRTKLEIYDSPAVISLRTLEPSYDVESLIRSVPLVLKEISETKFVIVGKGSDEKRLRKLATALGVSESVKFVGFIPNDELPQYLTASDVYVSTSPYDAGIAASTAEAMACELPVIVTDVAENKKWVEDGVNGFVVPIKDPKSLAKKIICLLENETVRRRFGKISRKIIEEKNNYYKEMEKMEDLYTKLVQRHEK
jgi:glycosyltransferase involved in cell wall biosynthesis